MEVRAGAAVLNEVKQVGGALLSNVGSPAALGLVAVVGGAALVAVGVEEAMREYNVHKSAEHLADVKKIMELHQTYLVEIDETGLGGRTSLPPPFDMRESKAPKAQKMNAALRKDLLRDKTIAQEPFLIPYSHHIKNAKRFIETFYEERLKHHGSSEDDVTSSVLVYLLIILNDHCTQFQGFQADIAIVEAVMRFCNAFASIPAKHWFKSNDPKERARFERMTPVCNELEEARQVLIDHSASRSLGSYMAELMTALGKSLFPAMEKVFTKFIVPEKDWPSVNEATEELLARGMLQPMYRHTGFVFPQKAVPLLESPFKQWVQNMTDHFLQPDKVARMSVELRPEDWQGVSVLFKACPNFLTLKAPQPGENGKCAEAFVPVGHDESCYVKIVSIMPGVLDWNGFLILKSGPKWQLMETQENGQSTELNIAEVPGLVPALQSLQQKPLEHLSQRDTRPVNEALTRYRNLRQLKARGQIYIDLALLMWQLTDLFAFSLKLSECNKKLGEIYMQNPHHCNLIFAVLDGLGKEIENQVDLLMKAMDRVKGEQRGVKDMLIEGQKELEAQLRRQLPKIRATVASNIAGILGQHKVNRHGNPRARGPIHLGRDGVQRRSTIQEMLILTAQVAARYKIDVRAYEPVLPQIEGHAYGAGADHKLEEKQARPGGAVGLVLPPVKQPQDEGRGAAAAPNSFGDAKRVELPPPQKSVVLLSPPLVDPVPQRVPSPRSEPGAAHLPEVKQQEGAAPGQATVGEPGEEDYISDGLLRQIQARITQISKDEKPDPGLTSAYRDLKDALDELDLKGKTMEKEKDAARHKKALATRKLCHDLCQNTLEFLNLGSKKRVEMADMKKDGHFTSKMKGAINTPGNRILDEHRSTFTKIMRAVKEVVYCLLLFFGFVVAYRRGGFFRTDTRAAAYAVGERCAAVSRRLAVKH